MKGFVRAASLVERIDAPAPEASLVEEVVTLAERVELRVSVQHACTGIAAK